MNQEMKNEILIAIEQLEAAMKESDEEAADDFIERAMLRLWRLPTPKKKVSL